MQASRCVFGGGGGGEGWQCVKKRETGFLKNDFSFYFGGGLGSDRDKTHCQFPVGSFVWFCWVKIIGYYNRTNFRTWFNFVLLAESTKFSSIRKPYTYTSVSDSAFAVRKFLAYESRQTQEYEIFARTKISAITVCLTQHKHEVTSRLLSVFFFFFFFFFFYLSRKFACVSLWPADALFGCFKKHGSIFADRPDTFNSVMCRWAYIIQWTNPICFSPNLNHVVVGSAWNFQKLLFFFCQYIFYKDGQIANRS